MDPWCVRKYLKNISEKKPNTTNNNTTLTIVTSVVTSTFKNSFVA